MALLLFSLVIAQRIGSEPTPPQNQQDFRLASKSGYLKVPFDFDWNSILLRARINNSRTIWFLLDTGASVNVINDRVIVSLGLESSGASSLNAGGGTASGTFVKGATIRLPGMEVSKQTFAAVPLDPFPAYFNREAQGLLGTSFMANFVVAIDYLGKTLTFYDPKLYNLSGEPNAIELENRGGMPFVKVELSLTGQDTITGWFELDTGSNRIFQMNRAFAEEHKIFQSLPGADMAEGVGGTGLGGDTRFTDARINSIKLGDYTIRRPVISISQDTAGYGASADAGVIGQDLLRRFTVVLDLQSHRMLLKPNAHFNEPFEVDMSGLELTKKPGDYRVILIKKVRAHFPAADAGLQSGDELVRINGRSAANFSLGELAEMFKQAGKEYRLTLRRGVKLLVVKLKMRRAV